MEPSTQGYVLLGTSKVMIPRERSRRASTKQCPVDGCNYKGNHRNLISHINATRNAPGDSFDKRIHLAWEPLECEHCPASAPWCFLFRASYSQHVRTCRSSVGGKDDKLKSKDLSSSFSSTSPVAKRRKLTLHSSSPMSSCASSSSSAVQYLDTCEVFEMEGDIIAQQTYEEYQEQSRGSSSVNRVITSSIVAIEQARENIARGSTSVAMDTSDYVNKASLDSEDESSDTSFVEDVKQPSIDEWESQDSEHDCSDSDISSKDLGDCFTEDDHLLTHTFHDDWEQPCSSFPNLSESSKSEEEHSGTSLSEHSSTSEPNASHMTNIPQGKDFGRVTSLLSGTSFPEPKTELNEKALQHLEYLLQVEHNSYLLCHNLEERDTSLVTPRETNLSYFMQVAELEDEDGVLGSSNNLVVTSNSDHGSPQSTSDKNKVESTDEEAGDNFEHSSDDALPHGYTSSKVPSWKNKTLCDLYPHLVECFVKNGYKPINGNVDVMNTVDEIHNQRRNRLNLTSGCDALYLPYASLLKLTTRPGVPDKMYDEIAKHISLHWSLKEDFNTGGGAPPSRKTLTKWIDSKVHGSEKHIKDSKPFQENLQLPSGRSVILTKNNLVYQLALMFSDDDLMRPENLIFPDPHNPEKIPDFNTMPLGDVNTGIFYQETSNALNEYISFEKRYSEAIGPEEYPKIPMSFQLFIDGTMVARNSVEPISMCPCIFKREIRNLARSWFILGYIEPECNYVGTHTPPTTNARGEQIKKLEDYHAIVGDILADFSKLQTTGFLLKVPVPSVHDKQTFVSTEGGFGSSWDNLSEYRTIHFFPVLQLVISDCKGANTLAGRYGGHSKVKCLVRDCDVPSSDGDLPRHSCKMFLHLKMKELIEERLNELSFHKLQKNGFDDIVIGWNARYRHFGLSPPEILHMFWLGLCDYLWEGFYEKIGGDARSKLNLVSIRNVVWLTRQTKEEKDFFVTEDKGKGFQVMSMYPSVACFRNGIAKSRVMMHGKEKFSRIFLLYCCFLDSDFIELLSNHKKRNSDFTWDRDKVKEWFTLLGWSLSLNMWFASKEHDRKFFCPGIPAGGMDTPLTKDELLAIEPIAQVAMRDYLLLYKKLVNRSAGEGLRLTKFHEMLHLVHYTAIHGSMTNFDGSRPESIGKSLVKDPGARSQHQVALLTFQAATKLRDSRSLDSLATVIKSSSPHLFQRYQMERCFMDTREIRADAAVKVIYLNENGEKKNKCIPQKKKQPNNVDCNSIRLNGTRFTLSIGSSGTLCFSWQSKTEYKSTWNNIVFKYLEENLRLGSEEHLGTYKSCKFHGFTELTVVFRESTQESKVVKYRAHPTYRGKTNWHSWADVEWIFENGSKKYYPARIIMFFTPCSTELAQSLFNLGNFSGLSESNAYALIQSVDSSKGKQTYQWPRLNGGIHVHHTMEPSFLIVPVEAMVTSVTMIPNNFYAVDNEAGARLSMNVKECTEILPSSFWAEHFYNYSPNARRLIKENQ